MNIVKIKQQTNKQLQPHYMSYIIITIVTVGSKSRYTNKADSF